MRVRLRRHTFASGRERMLELEIGRLRLFFSRYIGVYGFENTVSYGVRGWWER